MTQPSATTRLSTQHSSDEARWAPGRLDPLRRGVLLLGAAAGVGTMAELASLRHWEGSQLIPWFVLAALFSGIALAWRSIQPRLVRMVAVAGTFASIYGLWEHIESNHDAGPLDRRYETTWSTFSAMKQWWLAATGGAGPSPALAPLAMVVTAACLWLATSRPTRSAVS